MATRLNAADNPAEKKRVMAQLISNELHRLAREADVTVFALYASGQLEDPIDYYCVNRHDPTAMAPRISLGFDGVGVWYFAFRSEGTFKVRKVLIQIEDQRFITGQVGDFEGIWEDFPTYVAEDRWVSTVLGGATPANDLRFG